MKTRKFPTKRPKLRGTIDPSFLDDALGEIAGEFVKTHERILAKAVKIALEDILGNHFMSPWFSFRPAPKKDGGLELHINFDEIGEDWLEGVERTFNIQKDWLNEHITDVIADQDPHKIKELQEMGRQFRSMADQIETEIETTSGIQPGTADSRSELPAKALQVNQGEQSDEIRIDRRSN